MGRQQIEFVINRDGSVTEKVDGVVGPHCEELTKKIEERLGEVTDREHRPEYWNRQHIDTAGHGEQSASTGGDLH